MAFQAQADRARLLVLAGMFGVLASCLSFTLSRPLEQETWVHQVAPVRLSMRINAAPVNDVTPGLGERTVTQPPAVSSSAEAVAEQPAYAEDVAFSNMIGELEEMGTVMSGVTKAAFPLLAAALALVSGFLMRKVMPSVQATVMKPMEMEASEDTPLSRRGVLAALGTLPMIAASPAFAARSGGRVGGSSFRSFKAAPPPAAAPPAGAAVGGTTVFVTPPPPVAVSPFGFGMAPVPSYGFGFSTGELLALSALELGEAFVREQRRQEFIKQQLETQRKLGQDEAQIQALQQQLAAQEQRMRDLESAMMQKGVPSPAS